MAIERLKIGESIPAVLNAFDGNTGLFPRAIYTNEDTSTIFATNDMAHTANGKYVDRSENFPSTTLVTVIYKVYSNAAHTVLDPDYQDMLDVFLQADAAPTPGSVSIVERLTAKLDQQDQLAARMIEPKLQAVLIDPRIRAAVIQGKISARIKREPIIHGLIMECE